MNKIEAAARADGIDQPIFFNVKEGKWQYKKPRMVLYYDVPDYEHDYNAVHRLVQGLDDNKSERKDYFKHLYSIVSGGNWFFGPMVDFRCVVLDMLCEASCEQMFEAWCKVKGVWE